MKKLEILFNRLTEEEKKKFIINHLNSVDQFTILECLSIDVINDFINDLE